MKENKQTPRRPATSAQRGARTHYTMTVDTNAPSDASSPHNAMNGRYLPAARSHA